ncbi:restriction endonuclease subunit S [Bacteroides sp. BFG-551]|nr:restriction endonuclease subunit S [Bacteroides sp. BFG-551]
MIFNFFGGMIETRFKKTDIGKIPEDWEVKKLGNISNIKTGPFGSALHASDYVLEGTPIITVEHIGDIHINTNIPIPMINEQDKERLMPYSLKEGDIVFSRVGSVDRNSIITVKEEGWLFSGRLLRVRSYNFVNSLYLSYHLSSQQAKKRVISSAVGLAMPSINTKILSEIDIILPVLRNEQNRIATTLSDIDALLSILNKAIEKKKLIKQGVMQQLLTGKKRLNGFTESWIEEKLGNISLIKTGCRNGNEAVENGKYPFFVRSQTVYRINSYSFDGEAIIIPGEGGIGSIYHYINGKFDYHQRVYKISDFPKNIYAKYIYFYMKQNFGDYATNLSVKATVDSLRLSAFSNFVLYMPPSKAEQIAIATILSDMDAEIEALEMKRAKYEQVKQGMMQQLLTGKIRLID